MIYVLPPSNARLQGYITNDVIWSLVFIQILTYLCSGIFQRDPEHFEIGLVSFEAKIQF